MFDERVAAWNGKDVADLEELYALFPDDAALEAATTPALSGDAKAQVAATWLQKRSLEDGATWDRERTSDWIRRLEDLDPWEARLHALQCLPHLTPPPRSRGPLERFTRACWDGDNKFVRAWSLTGFDTLARCFDCLEDEVLALLESVRDDADEPASVRARARQLLKRRR